MGPSELLVNNYIPRTQPFPHQVKLTLNAVRARNHGMFGDPGVGKTKAAIDYIGMLHQAGHVRRVAVICPLTVIPVWEEELHKHAPFDWASADDLDFTHADEGDVLIYLTNYDKFSRRVRNPDYSWRYPHIETLEAFCADAIIFDESHRLKSAGSNRSQALWRSVKRQRARRTTNDSRPWVLLLTGTPNPKGYIDIFSQYRVMDDSIFGTARKQFEDCFCVYGSGRNKYRILSYKNRDILEAKINENCTIIPESAADLPPRTFQNVPVTLPPEARRVYNELAEELIVELEDGEILTAKTAGTRRLRLSQIAGGFLPDKSEIHGAKRKALRDLMQDLLDTGGTRVVIYARFLAEVHAVCDDLEELGFDVLPLTGATPNRVRVEYRKLFQSNRRSPLAIVAQVAVGGLGITLTAACEMVWYSLPDAWDQYYQGVKRIHRVGQTRAVRIRHIVANDTVDRSQLKALRRKADMHAELMKSPRAYLFGG